MALVRKISLAFCVLLAFLSGCSTTKPISLAEAEYTISEGKEIFTKDQIQVTLLYPIIEHYADAETETAVNQLAYQKVQEEFSRAGVISSGEDDLYTYIALGMTVTLAEADFYSAYVYGMITSEFSGETDYFSYTINMDIANRKLYTTEDILLDYPSFRRAFEKGRFVQDFGYELLDQEVSWSDMIDQYKEKYGIYPDLYFREGELGILVEVVPVLGGCAGYTVEIRDAWKWMYQNDSVLRRISGMQ